MKIALVIEAMELARGGREVSTMQIASELARRGHDVTILCQRGQSADPAVRVMPLGECGEGKAGRLRRFIADVQSVARRKSFDVVHAMLPVPGAHVYQPRGGTLPGQAAASVRRRAAWKRPLARLGYVLNGRRRQAAAFERQVVADARAQCLAVSPMVAREFADYFGRRDNVRVIFNAVDVPAVSSSQRLQWRRELRARWGVADGETAFVTAATNFPLKGVGQAIEATALWNRAGGRGKLIVIGGYDADYYRWLARANGLTDAVIFAGAVESIFPALSAADVCVLLSWYDPCSRVVLEATRWGVPSITTVFNGAAEALAGGCGVVVASPRDVQAVAAAMTRLTDPAERGKRAAACLAAADQLTIQRHVDGLLEVYETVIAG